MKILCVCQGGNSRSVAMAYYLKKWKKHDALSFGFRDNGAEVLSLLCSWADIIIPMREEYKQVIPEMFHDKVRVIDVGRDKYLSIHKELLYKCKKGWEGLNLC